MITYLLQTSSCWIVFYLFYFLVLRRETFFTSNRFYLLGSLLFGVVFPLIDFSWWSILTKDTTASIMMQPLAVTVNQLGYTLEEVVVTANQSDVFSAGSIIAGIYCLGVAFLSLRLVYGIYALWRLKNQSSIEEKSGYQLVKTETLHLPFSFFNALYWSKKLDLSAEDEDRILRHELTHIQQHHSIDIILLEITSILFWFNPIIWFYRTAIRNTHEYLADQKVLIQSKKKQYGQLLLRQMQSGIAFSLANNFNHSQLKKRFNMMNQNKSSRWAITKYIWALPLLAVLLLAFKASDQLLVKSETTKVKIPTLDENPPTIIAYGKAKTTETNTAIVEKNLPVNISSNDSIYTEVDQMPFFPGCADIADLEERKSCATQKLLTHIYTNIKYPELARKTGTQGLIVIRFVVDEMGKITKSEIVKSLGNGCDIEVSRVVGTMPDWEPGIHQGKPVSVYFNLPVKFKLEGDPPKVDESAKPISLSIFPNPTAKDITVKINADTGPATLYISDITGKVLKEVNYEDFSGTGEESFDLTSLGVKGTLLVTVAQGTIIKTEQVILR